jgi:hypothetical protein
MSESDDSSRDGVEGVEDALNRLNLSIRSYNKSKQEGEKAYLSSLGSTALDLEASQAVCNEYAKSIEWSTGAPMFSRAPDAAGSDHFPNITNPELRKRLSTLHELRDFLSEHPYSIDLYSRIANAYADCGYPDLAAGAAYKALLLIDQLDDEGAEFYEPTFLSLAESVSKKSLVSRCAMLEKDADLQQSLFHPAHAHRDEEGNAQFPVLEQEVHLWAKEEHSREV